VSAVLQEKAPEPMTDAELISVIDDAEARSYGSIASGSSEIANLRSTIISLFLGENLEPSDEGSNATDRTVFEIVQGILPSLCRIFANGEDVVTLDPVSEADIPQAKQETSYMNWLVTTTMPWFELFLEWATDALLAPNSYFLVYRDRKRTVDIDRYEGQTREGLALLLQDPNVQLIASQQYEAKDLPPEPVIGPDGQPVLRIVGVDPMSQQPIIQPVLGPAMLYDVVIRRVSSDKKLCIRVLPPERVKVDQQTYSWRINESCNYFEYYEEVTLSDLRAQGFDAPDDISDTTETETPEDTARDQFGESRLDGSSPTDPSMRKVVARMVWVRVDADRDGIAELLQILRVGQTVFYREEVSRIPIASGASCPLPHRHPGMPVAQQVADIQVIKTDLLRSGLNNIYLSNNPQKVLNENFVNVEDATVSRVGGIIRATDINQIRHEAPPFVFPQAVEGLEYMNQIAQNRAGVNAGMASVDSSNLNNIQPGTVNQLTSIAAEKTVQIARVLAFGIEDLFAILHEQTLKMGHKKQAIRISGKWEEVDPGSWKRRDAFKICVAFGAGNKEAQVTRLALLAQKQELALTAGIPVCTPENYYETLTELTKAIDITAAGRFWTAPQKMPARPPPPPPEGIVKEQMATQSAEKIKAAELAQRERESVRESELKRYQIDSENGLEIVHKHIEHGHTVAVEGLKASHAAILEALSRKFDADQSITSKAVNEAHQKNEMSLGDIRKTLDKAFESMRHVGKLATAKRVARRNDKNEIEGVDLLDHDGTVLASHTAVKDKSGRIVGMQ
jgi:hypothetical protein